jgi:hypothetical protein
VRRRALSACVFLSHRPRNRSMGFGLVNYAAVADARRAIESLNGRELCGKPLEVRFANADRSGGAGALRGGGGPPPHPSAAFGYDAGGGGGALGDVAPSPNLYIKGLPPGTTDVGLRNVFAPFGNIVDSRVLYPQSPAPSALLRYNAVHEAAAAIAAMHNVTPPGATNALQVRFAESPADKARRAVQVGAGRGGGAPGELAAPRIPPPAIPTGTEAIERVECPPSLVGWLIGRGGETIKGLQARSGSAITIEQNLPEGVPRVVIIAGTRDQVTLGKQLVEELLASGAARGGGTWPGGGGPPPGGPPPGGNGAPPWGGRADWSGAPQQGQPHQAPPPPAPNGAPAGTKVAGARPLHAAHEELAEEPEPCVVPVRCACMTCALS